MRNYLVYSKNQFSDLSLYSTKLCEGSLGFFFMWGGLVYNTGSSLSYISSDLESYAEEISVRLLRDSLFNWVKSE